MDDQSYVYATAAVILTVFVVQIARRSFDPFAPLWLFLAGYAQVYVVQAISYREYALRVRGLELTTAANERALWALLWFLAVYFSGIGRWLAKRLPSAPSCWSPGLVVATTPFLLGWGLYCARIGFIRIADVSPEEALLLQFPILMLVCGVMYIVTGRSGEQPRTWATAFGLLITASYSLIWMFNGKRSHALFGVLAGIAAFYFARRKRPSLIVLALTAFLGASAVSLAIGWRNNPHYDRTPAGFLQFAAEFELSNILVNLNMKERESVRDDLPEYASRETEEYGGFLLMMAAVPERSDYDYGESYLRLISTYIPRIIWPDKPLFGRSQWVNAWIAGSEFKRDETFTGPAIGLLGATQLNGGAIGTLIVLAVLALLIRTAYEYFRLYDYTPWAQAWWALTFFNAWLMTVNDDPFVWFYYVYGHTIFPCVAMLWLFHKLADRGS